MSLAIHAGLAESCRRSPARAAWLARLPDVVGELVARWVLELAAPFDSEVSAAWVAPATRADGTAAVLKLGMPHFEAEHEVAGLRFWAGDPTVRLLEADEALNAMLLERCEPGTVLRARPEPEQDVVIAGLLRRMWRAPPEPHPFRPLAEMTARWSDEARTVSARWADAGLVRAALSLFDELTRTGAPSRGRQERPSPGSDPGHVPSRRGAMAGDVLLATDLHAGNVLRARREPWLAIDPKPFVGDPAYDATQHILNCERLRTRPLPLIRRVAGLLDVDAERVRLWTFARIAIEHWDPAAPDSARHLALARTLAP